MKTRFLASGLMLFSLAFVLTGFLGCIPSAPQQGDTQAPPASAVGAPKAETTPPPAAAAATPEKSANATSEASAPAAPVSTPVSAAPAPAAPEQAAPPPIADSEGEGESSKNTFKFSDSDPNAEPNASISINKMPDGQGFTFEGTFGLKGTIVLEGKDKWRLKGAYNVREEDFKPGPVTSSRLIVDDEVIAPAVLVTFPAAMPRTKASEDKPVRTIPIELEINASEKATFNLIFINM